MDTAELARIKESALTSIAPSLLQVDKGTGIYSLVGEEGQALAVFTVEDVPSFNFHTSASFLS